MHLCASFIRVRLYHAITIFHPQYAILLRVYVLL